MTAVEHTPAARAGTEAVPAPRPGRLHRVLGPGPVPWGTVLALAVLLSLADGFIVTAVQGAVGAIERTGEPFASWMRTSLLSLPVFALAVLAALATARRRFGPAIHTPKRVVVTALLIAVAATLVGTALVVASAAYDYHLQSEQIRATVASHGHAHHGLSASQQQAATLAGDEAGARDAARYIALANVVLVAWVTALRGGRLDAGRRRVSP